MENVLVKKSLTFIFLETMIMTVNESVIIANQKNYMNRGVLS